MKHHIFLYISDITYDGGVERVVCNMANAFARRGYAVDIISMFQSGNSIKYSLPETVMVKYLFAHQSFGEMRSKSIFRKYALPWRVDLAIKHTPKLYSYIDSRLADGETAVVFSNSYLFTAPIYRHRNVRMIGVDHSRYPFGKMTKGLRHWLHTSMIRNFDVVTTLNEDELDKWKSIGLPVYVIPNFLPSAMMGKNDGNANREKVVLSMGRMNTDQKGFDRLIDAYSLIGKKHPDWKLKIYGSGALQAQYKKQVETLGLDDHVEINDFTTNPQKAYQSASIYAMCSREEGFSMVLLEAGNKGLPLVAYDVEFGPKTIIRNGKTGYVIPDGDTQLFANALERLMENDELRQNMSDEVSKDIVSRYSEDSIIEKWIEIIDKL